MLKPLIQNDVAFSNKEDAIAALSSTKDISEGYTLDGSMLSGEEKIIALVVYMPDTTGIEANYKTGTPAPEINMGVTLLATQASYETDGFNKFYDSSAAYQTVSTAVVAGEETVLKLGSVAKIVVPTNAKVGSDDIADGDVLTFTLEPNSATPEGFTVTSGAGVVTYDISVVD